MYIPVCFLQWSRDYSEIFNRKESLLGGRLPGDVEITPEERKALVTGVVKFFDTAMEQELSEFRAEMILDYFIERLSPVVYNGAIADAGAFIAERLEDMEATLFAKTPR